MADEQLRAKKHSSKGRRIRAAVQLVTGTWSALLVLIELDSFQSVYSLYFL